MIVKTKKNLLNSLYSREQITDLNALPSLKIGLMGAYCYSQAFNNQKSKEYLNLMISEDKNE